MAIRATIPQHYEQHNAGGGGQEGSRSICSRDMVHMRDGVEAENYVGFEYISTESHFEETSSN